MYLVVAFEKFHLFFHIFSVLVSRIWCDEILGTEACVLLYFRHSARLLNSSADFPDVLERRFEAC